MSDNKTYVFGHQNPDTDSICSALAYANLKQAEGHKDVQAARITMSFSAPKSRI